MYHSLLFVNCFFCSISEKLKRKLRDSFDRKDFCFFLPNNMRVGLDETVDRQQLALLYDGYVVVVFVPVITDFQTFPVFF